MRQLGQGVPWAGPLAGLIAEGVPPSAETIASVTGAVRDRIGEGGAAKAADQLGAALLGLGPLEPFARDEGVSDILVNGDGSVWVETDGTVTRAGSLEPASVRPLAVRLAGLAGRRLDDAQPSVDGHLPGGIRVHAILPPLAAGGCHISLRFAGRQTLDLDALVAVGSLPRELARVLDACVSARLSLLVSGGTGAGKTTVLRALLARVPHTERIVVAEDVTELNPVHPHVVSLQTRPGNVEGVGGVGLVDLVRQMLRMRPDRIVIGEVRGAEISDLLLALNTGHEGGAGTLHANSAVDVVARCEALGALAGLSPDAVHLQLRSAIQVVVHVAKVDGRRRVSEVAVIDVAAGRVSAVPALRFRGDVLTPDSGWPLLSHLLLQRGQRPPDLCGSQL